MLHKNGRTEPTELTELIEKHDKDKALFAMRTKQGQASIPILVSAFFFSVSSVGSVR